jgi:hypothetical protein
MSKKPEETKAMAMTEGFKPMIVSNPVEFFDGFEMQSCVTLAETGHGFEGILTRRGVNLEIPRADGQGVDEVGTWMFDVGKASIRLMGSTILDRDLGAIEHDYILPVRVKVMRSGEKDIGKGKTVTLYYVAVDRKGKLKKTVGTKTDDPF